MSAAAHGHIRIVDALMAAGASVHRTNLAGTTALMMASEEGHTAMIEKLIAAGADVNARTEVRVRRGEEMAPRSTEARVCVFVPALKHMHVALT